MVPVPRRPRECPPARVLEHLVQSGQELLHPLLCVYMVLEYCLRHGLCDMASDASSLARASFVEGCYDALKTLSRDELRAFTEQGPWADDAKGYMDQAIKRSKKEFGISTAGSRWTVPSGAPTLLRRQSQRPLVKPSAAPGVFGLGRRRQLRRRGRRGC